MTAVARPRFALVLAAVVAGLAGLVVVAAPAGAIAPFPIADPTNGAPGTSDPHWTATANSVASNKYTSDGWLRLNDNGTSRQADLLNPTAFPASAGFEVDFDYRQAGGTPFADKNGTRTGDGLTMFLIDGTNGAAAGAVGNGLAYGAGSGVGACGMPGGYLGLGLDVFGNYAVGDKGNYGGFGGVGSTTALPNAVDLRGSGSGNLRGGQEHLVPVGQRHFADLDRAGHGVDGRRRRSQRSGERGRVAVSACPHHREPGRRKPADDGVSEPRNAEVEPVRRDHAGVHLEPLGGGRSGRAAEHAQDRFRGIIG